MVHFLLVYDHKQEKLLEERVFTDAQEAADAYSAAEAKVDNRHRGELEIVLVGSDSIETVHRTHGHYFRDGAPVSKYLTGV